MAFPTPSAAAETNFSSTVTVMAVNIPGSISSGDLLIAFSSVRNPCTWTLPTGWANVSNQASGGVGELTFFYKISDGTEVLTQVWTASTGNTAAWHMFAISTWHGTTPPEVTKATSGGTPGSPANSPSLTPSWGSADTLWFSIAQSAAEGITYTAAPTNYSNFLEEHVSAGGASVEIASGNRQLTASSDDPGAFTSGANPRWWDAMTVAVRPSGAAAPSSPPGYKSLLGVGI